jgi:hypothetical protein
MFNFECLILKHGHVELVETYSIEGLRQAKADKYHSTLSIQNSKLIYGRV